MNLLEKSNNIDASFIFVSYFYISSFGHQFDEKLSEKINQEDTGSVF